MLDRVAEIDKDDDREEMEEQGKRGEKNRKDPNQKKVSLDQQMEFEGQAQSEGF